MLRSNRKQTGEFIATFIVCDDGDYHVTWNLQFFKQYAYFNIKIPIFPYTLGNFATRSVLWPKICRKCKSGRGSGAGGAHHAPPDPLVGWGADTFVHSPPHSAPRSSYPLTPNPVDATGHHHFLR